MMNIVTGFRIAFFCYYTTVVLGLLYYRLGEITFNYNSSMLYSLSMVIAFFLIELALLLVAVWELYSKCINLNYEIKLVK